MPMGDVPFQQDALLARVGAHCQQLNVKQVLQVVVESYLRISFVSGGTQLRYFVCLIGTVGRPLVEVGGAVQVAQVTEGSVRTQPFFIAAEEVQEIF